MAELEPNVPYQYCDFCSGEGTYLVESIDGEQETVPCPVGCVEGLVPHENCTA